MYPRTLSENDQSVSGEPAERIEDARVAFTSGSWHEVNIVLRAESADADVVDNLYRHLEPFATGFSTEGVDLAVKMLVPASDGRAAADLALDLVEAGACRAGGRLSASGVLRASHEMIESGAVSA